MNVNHSVDREVKMVDSVSLDDVDDPVAQLFFDRTTSTGVRLLAVAEPVNRTPHGFLTAAAALAAFEEAVIVAIKVGIEPGLYRAFAAANDAVRAANHRTHGSLRAYTGVTAVAIDGQHATIGYVPPGQVLIFQDGRMYGVPDLATWEPGFMPWSDSEEPEPLGFSPVPRPRFRRTIIGSGDQFMLGESSVGRVLAKPEFGSFDDLTEENVVTRVEEGLAASGVEDAYAAWIRCDKAAARSVNEARMAEIERIWHSQPGSASGRSELGFLVDPRQRRAIKRDQWRERLIETSERLFGRREVECLPLESYRRTSAPVGAGSLHRYVAPHHPTFTPWFRAWLPRGLRLPHSRRSFAALIAVLLVVASVAVTQNVRDTRAAKQDLFLSVAEIEILQAQSATSRDAAASHIELANNSLDNALANGADSDLISDWRNDLAEVEDRWNGVGRFTEMKRIGTIPENLNVEKPQLIQVGSSLFLIAGGVYQIDESKQQLMSMLEPGVKIDGLTVRSIVSAAVDGEDLLVTDGRSLFRLDESMTWSSSRIASSTAGDGWNARATGAYKGSYYLFDANAKQINKFDGSQLDEQPVEWLNDKAVKHATHVVDMVVDTDIYLLTTDGSIFSFNRGKVGERYQIPDASDRASMVGLYGGTELAYLYVVEIDNKRGELVRYDAVSQERILYLAPAPSHLNFNGAATNAFSETVDFAVDENAGVIYFVTPDGVWRASFN